MAFPKSIVILTGAGISAESGLGTFRDKDGIWTKYPLEDLASPEGFARNPDFVQRFYNERRAQLKTAQPNAAHVALARLQTVCEAEECEYMLVTQNVDNLHEQAGSTDVVHMHGELAQARCTGCGAVTECDHDIGSGTPCPACTTTGGMRPHVVWFGEMPLEMDRIGDALSRCDMFISIGTSGSVYPAAGFVSEARYGGAQTVELNLEPSENSDAFTNARYGAASVVVPAWVRELIGEH